MRTLVVAVGYGGDHAALQMMSVFP